MQVIQDQPSPTARFAERPIPTLLAQRQLPRPIAFTRMRSEGIGGEPIAIAGQDAAFVLLVAMAPLVAGSVSTPETPTSPRETRVGDTFVFDLETGPMARFAGPYDFVRFDLPTATLDQLADDGGLPRVRGLQTTPAQVRDPVMNGLALSLLPALEAPDTAASQFVDSIGLAFHAHVTRRYGRTATSRASRGPRLASWQLRRVRAFVDAGLERNVSVADLARECRLSASHFGRRFSASTGMSPHRWVTSCRIERAKGLLLGGGHELSDVALACGFADQSHLTRVFTRLEGQSPGRWRRQHRH